jgi:hypothetical protein
VTDLARAAIRRLRSGVVPEWELERLSVGYGDATKLVELSLAALDLPGELAPLFVRGEWGSGKTHFLAYLQAAALRSGAATAKIDLNARSAALNYPQRIFSTLAENLRARRHVGVQAIMIDILSHQDARQRMKSFAHASDVREISFVIEDLCRQFEFGERLDLGTHPAWSILHGVDLSWSDHSSKRDKALARMECLGLLCRAVGLRGLVLLLDEAETIDQLWNARSRIAAYDVLGRLCRMDGVWCVFGTTLRFDRTIKRDIDAGFLQMDLGSSAATDFLKRWQKGLFQLFEPPTISVRDAGILARAIKSLYEGAYGELRGLDDQLERCLTDWRKNPGRNPRRLIRSLVDTCDSNRGVIAI